MESTSASVPNVWCGVRAGSSAREAFESFVMIRRDAVGTGSERR